jgi:hypothetical protein
MAMASRIAEQDAGQHHVDRPPFGEDQRGERDEAFTRRHVLHKAGVLGNRQVSPRKTAENAAADYRAIPKPGHRDPGRINGGGVFADGAQAQSEPGSEENPPGKRHSQEGYIDKDRVPGNQFSE